MEFVWQVEDESVKLKTFLKGKGVSKKLLAKIKFHGGTMLVNDSVQNALHVVTPGDIVKIIIPDEGEHETLIPYDAPLEIVFEDEHLLVVNKPKDVASIPAQYHPVGTMAHRVKHYYNEQKYVNRVVHVVTRLDRDTTGLMLFAKHGFAHAMLDKQLQNKTLNKYYTALVSGKVDDLSEEGQIDLKIGRDMTSLIKRQVTEDGQEALTNYWLEKKTAEVAQVKIQLKTGRTHQIRVHFSGVGCPLLGDNLYGGNMDLGIDRQALEPMILTQEIPEDMKQVMNQ
jgi:23S rRNA pseudouridine1911/1915/1917 synthase